MVNAPRALSRNRFEVLSQRKLITVLALAVGPATTVLGDECLHLSHCVACPGGELPIRSKPLGGGASDDGGENPASPSRVWTCCLHVPVDFPPVALHCSIAY
jgi:hypothetical protein